jgi:hypothetical protein
LANAAPPSVGRVFFVEIAGAAARPQQQTSPDERYPEYDPVEGADSFSMSNDDIPTNNYVPTPNEIAKRKYVIRPLLVGAALDALAVRHG